MPQASKSPWLERALSLPVLRSIEREKNVSKKPSPVVTEFLILLGTANSVRVESPLLTYWDTYDPTGDAGNVVAEFSWVETNKKHSVLLTEGGIGKGKWLGESFYCEDSEGNGIEISLFRHVGITPNAQTKS